MLMLDCLLVTGLLGNGRSPIYLQAQAIGMREGVVAGRYYLRYGRKVTIRCGEPSAGFGGDLFYILACPCPFSGPLLRTWVADRIQAPGYLE